MPRPLTRDAVEPRLRGRLGRPYVWVESCPSTQLLLDGDAPEGATAVAEEQTAGRGRLGRRWDAPPRTSILASILLRPPVPADRLPELTIVAAEAVADAIRATTGLVSTLKPPNDVLVDGRKVAGVLGEAGDGRVVLGIGVNANQAESDLPADVRLPATSLRLETGGEVDRVSLLLEILDTLELRYDAWVAGAAFPRGA